MCRRQEETTTPVAAAPDQAAAAKAEDAAATALDRAVELCERHEALVNELLCAGLEDELNGHGPGLGPPPDAGAAASLAQVATTTRAALAMLQAARDLGEGGGAAKRARVAGDASRFAPVPRSSAHSFNLAAVQHSGPVTPARELTPASVAELENLATARSVISGALTVLRGLLPTAGIDPQLFSLERIREQHGAQRVSVLHQRSVPEGGSLESNQRPTRSMPLRAAVDAVLAGTPDQEWVSYTPYIDMTTWAQETAELGQRMPHWMWSNAPSSLLRLLPQPVVGITSPQCYVKMANVWTAAHRENVCLTSVNCNHGPSSSLWVAVGEEHVPALREYVLKSRGVDVLQLDGAWFPDLRECQAAGVPLQYAEQRAGDVVVLRGGSMHWVQGRGPSVHSCWNVLPFEDDAMRQLLDQHVLNQRLEPPPPSLLPVHGLSVAVARELAALADGASTPFWRCSHMRARLRAHLMALAWHAREEVDALTARVPSAPAEQPGAQAFSCACNREILSTYAFCASCAKNNDIRSGAKRRKKRLALYQTVYCAHCVGDHVSDKPHHALRLYTHRSAADYVSAAQALSAASPSRALAAAGASFDSPSRVLEDPLFEIAGGVFPSPSPSPSPSQSPSAM